jgi:hypothetical protein
MKKKLLQLLYGKNDSNIYMGMLYLPVGIYLLTKPDFQMLGAVVILLGMLRIQAHYTLKD